MEAEQQSKRLIQIDERPYVAIREEYLAICAGEACPAALLNYLERFSLWKQGQGFNDAEWVYKKQPELVGDLLGLWGLTTIRRWLTWLVEVGLVEQRRNPDHKWDATPQYRFDADAVDLAVEQCLTNGFVSVGQLDSSESDECIHQDLTSRVIEFWRIEYANGDEWSRQPPINRVVGNGHLIFLESFLDFLLRLLSQESSSASAPARNDDEDAPIDFQAQESFDSQGNGKTQPVEQTVYALYAENVEAITPMIRDNLIDAVRDYGEGALRKAITQAVLHGVRKWAYVQKCLVNGARASPGEPGRIDWRREAEKSGVFVQT